MRNAGASIDPPSDPFAAVRPDSPVALPADRQYSGDNASAPSKPGRKKLPPGVSPLPPGVSPDIFAKPQPPGAGGLPAPPVILPPPAPPPEPWPMAASVPVRRSGDEPRTEQPVGIPPEPSEGRGRLWHVLLVVGGLALIFLLAYAIPATYMWGRVLPGTHVGDVRIGGLTETQALDRVHKRYDGNDQEEVGLTIEGSRVAVLDPRGAGLTIDVEGTIADAKTDFPGPLAVWQALTGDRDMPLRVSVNSAKLTQRIRKIAKGVDRPAREGEITYDGTTARVTSPKDGLLLDQGATAAAIKRAFVNAPASVPLPVSRVRPKAEKAAFDRALDMARRAVSAPITLTNDGRRVRLSPRVIAANLTFTADERGVVRPRFDAWKAVAGLETKLVGVAQAPREAGFVIEGGGPKLVHARTGKGVNATELAAAVVNTITSGGGRTIPVSLAVIEPNLSDEEALKLGVTQEVARSTTYFPCCAARVTNIRRSAELLDGRLVHPGETFSWNEAVGEPSGGRGFVAAQAVEDDRLVIAMGGGMSQVATTLYDATFLAGLDEIEHTAHAFYVARYPAGRDAAVSYPDQDLRWRNGTDHGVLVTTSSTSTSVTVTLWSTKKYDKVVAETSPRSDLTQPESRTDASAGCVPMEGGPGFTVSVTRAFYQDGEVVKRDRPEATVYEPQKKIVCQQVRTSPSPDPSRSVVEPQPSR